MNGRPGVRVNASRIRTSYVMQSQRGELREGKTRVISLYGPWVDGGPLEKAPEDHEKP